MDRIIDAAAYVIRRYREISGENLSETKLHKLLYFTQRESFAITGSPAFSGEFEGWKFGPVCKEVRANFFNGQLLVKTQDISEGLQYIINNVILEYGSLTAWKLSDLSHRDISWRNSRRGLSADDIGNVPLSNDDIKKDAAKVRPYDHVWDMYYDEFDDEVTDS